MTEKEAEMDGERLLCFACMRGALSGMSEGEDEAEMRAFLSKEEYDCIYNTLMKAISYRLSKELLCR